MSAGRNGSAGRGSLLHLLEERGQSLVLAMVIMSALTISIGAIVSLATGNEHQFGRDRQSNRAFSAAEAGLNNGFAIIANVDYTDGTPVNTKLPDSGAPGMNYSHTYSVAIDNATGHYWMTKYPAGSPECRAADSSSVTQCWVVDAVAVSPDGKVTRAVEQTTTWRKATQPVPDALGYGLFVDNQGGSCVTTHGNSNLVVGKVWIGGDFCPSGSVDLVPPADHSGSVYIGGEFQATNSTYLGAPVGDHAYPSGINYATANLAGGCTLQGNLAPCHVPSASHVYADDVPDAQPSNLQKPEIDGPGIWAEADWHGASANCNPPGAFTFDDNTVQDGTMATTTLMPASSTPFTCVVDDYHGNFLGSISWDGTTLSVNGTIYIDGNLDISNSGKYVGDGTIFVNGTVGGAGDVDWCGPQGTSADTIDHGCSPNLWDPNLGSLGLVVINPNNVSTAFNRTGQGELDITLLVNQGFADTGGTVIAGPVLADSASIGGDTGLVVGGTPPTNFPDSFTTQAAWIVQPGSWKQTR